jgi:hypothetical protein
MRSYMLLPFQRRTKMFSPEMIVAMNEQRCNEAKSQRLKPLVAYRKLNFEDIRSMPNFGDYRPKGWKLVRELFVDSSGLGQEGESALTIGQLLAEIKMFHGYAITEEGQFQVRISEFMRCDDDR